MDWRNWNNVVDVSSFMLFESTGDSDADSGLNMVASLSDDNMEVTYEVDDAQSCCSDSSESVQDHNDHHDQEYAQFPKKMSKKIEQEYVHYDYNPHYRDHNDDEDDDDDDDDDGAIDQDWSSGKEGFAFSRKKSNVYEDSTMEPKMKEEKDKLFWETCLAS